RRRMEAVLEGFAAPEEVASALAQLELDYQSPERALTLVQVAGGYQLRTRPEMAPWLRRFLAVKPLRFTQAARETLAIVAYRQPVTRGDIEDIRGVDSGGVLKALLDRKLVRIVGRKDIPGRPLLYGTTPEFLEHFGLKDLSQLPTLKEFTDLAAEGRLEQAADGGAAGDGGEPTDAAALAAEEGSGADEGSCADEGSGAEPGSGAEAGRAAEAGGAGEAPPEDERTS
ncbi:MAG TPA: SMC-Scp complex subunit ScpB, partial [Thermodesulfobacteriota bacterium]